jgi:hypothetical protein
MKSYIYYTLVALLFSLTLFLGISHLDMIRERNSKSSAYKTISPAKNQKRFPEFEALKRAYPDQIADLKENHIIFKDGSSLIYDDGKDKTMRELLKHPDIKDIFAQPYKESRTPPEKDMDPGRFRNTRFFRKIYGKTKNETEKHIRTITWMPGVSDVKIEITTVNGVDKKLLAVSEDLLKLPRYYQYVDNPAGGYVWRQIAGTDRQSAHAFGIAVDINLDYSNYWRWDMEENPEYLYTNRIPEEVVRCFENHGFIWGGRWYHYDTMHFEYRPELFYYEKK